MQYSCAIFKSENEDLKAAQLRKIHLLIDKAEVEEHHELLEIGCGWGGFAIEVVKKTGCRYTGITLSEEQLKFAEEKVKEAGLQDRISFLLCDYHELPAAQKYDRIILCEVLELFGNEYYEEFFGQCETVLADNGVLVIQTISTPDERHDAHVRSSAFMKEYIFPVECLPSLSGIALAMGAASRLCKIHSLGFDEKFLKVWEYCFDNCASGFMTRTLMTYQIVFTRQGNLVVFGDHHASIPSVHSYP